MAVRPPDFVTLSLAFLAVASSSSATAEHQSHRRRAGVEGTTLRTFAWDGLSRLITATDHHGGLRTVEVTRAYDSLSRLRRETQDGRAIASGYDDDVNRHSCECPGRLTIGASHDFLDPAKEVRDVARRALAPAPAATSPATEEGS